MSEENTQSAPVEEKPSTQPTDSAPKVEASKEVPTEVKKEESTTSPQEKKPEEVPYELKAPEGSLLDAKAIDEIKAFAKAQGLSQTQAEKLLMRENEAKSRFVEGQAEQLHQAAQTWHKQVSEDQELGGEKLKESVTLAKSVVDRFGSEALKKELNDSGLGNHPELVRLCARIGKAMSNDSLVVPGATSGTKKSMEEVFYGKSE